MKKYTVGEYMKKEVVTIPETATVKDTLRVMLEAKTNGLVVIDENRKVKGVIASLDLIRYFVPDYLESDRKLAEFESADMFVSRAKVIANDPIKKFMTTKVITVSENDSLIEAATLLTESQIRQLPVVDASGALVGYINRTDIKRAMGDVLTE